jgi:hypothetical protein
VLFGYNTTLEYVEYYDPIAEDWEPVAPPINELNDIGDVDITTPADGDLLVYDDGDWINQALATDQMPTGSILQVVSETKTDTFNTASGTFTDVTGLSVSITPSATASKVFVLVNLHFGGSGPGGAVFNIVRDTTAIAQPAAGTTPSSTRAVVGNNAELVQTGISVLDSPNANTATTYKIQMRVTEGGITGYINRNGLNNKETVSTITVMEVAG